MIDKVIKRLEVEFQFIEDEGDLISGAEAMSIINQVIKELTVPPDVEYAKSYMNKYDRDAGFVGSPEYSIQQEIVRVYNMEVAAQDKLDKLNYYRLRLKYERK